MGRFMVYPSIHHLTNDVMAVSSVILMRWIQEDINKDLYSDPNLSKEDFNMRVISNFARNVEYPF